MNRWYFWVLAPVMIAAAVIIPLAAEPPTVFGQLVTYIVSGALVFAVLGLADVSRHRWALRVVAAGVLLLGIGYFFAELQAWQSGKPFGLLGHKSERSLRNATFFMLLFGLPSLRYLLSGRSGTAVDVIAAPEGSSESGDGEAEEGPGDAAGTIPDD
jgi:hypothetical protein